MKRTQWNQWLPICLLLSLVCTTSLANDEPAHDAGEGANAATEAALEGAEGPPQGVESLDEFEPFDPLEGMDESGRIPSPEKPEDLEHPGRWRYIPEGRLKPGNVFQFWIWLVASPGCWSVNAERIVAALLPVIVRVVSCW